MHAHASMARTLGLSVHIMKALRCGYRLKEENIALREQTRDYTLLRKVFGSKQVDDMLTQAKQIQQAKRRQRQRNYER